MHLWNDSETPLDVRHDGQVAYVLQPGLNADVPDISAGFARAQHPDLVRRVSSQPIGISEPDHAAEAALPISAGLDDTHLQEPDAAPIVVENIEPATKSASHHTLSRKKGQHK